MDWLTYNHARIDGNTPANTTGSVQDGIMPFLMFISKDVIYQRFSCLQDTEGNRLLESVQTNVEPGAQ